MTNAEARDFVLSFDARSAAFDDGATYEVARILREVADKIEMSDPYTESYESVVRDVNGNSIGEVSFSRD